MWVYLVIILVSVRNSRSGKHGLFSRTSVVQNTCDLTTKIHSEITSSRLACAALCTGEPECRRFLFCSPSLSCQLYVDGTNCTVTGDVTGCSCSRRNIACDGGNCTCPLGYYGNTCENIIKDCQDGAVRQNIIFPPYRVLVNIKPTTATKPFEVRCFIRQFGWTNVMERNQDCLFENFNRSFVEYEEGFGSVPANRFIGLKNVRHLLNNAGTKTTLDIHLVQDNVTECNLYYDKFQLLGPSYAMYLDGFIAGTSLNCYNSLLGNVDLNGTHFSTYDFDSTGSNHCAARMGGGWWFANNVECARGFLTGTMDGSGTDNFWKDNFGEATLKLIAVDLRRVV